MNLTELCIEDILFHRGTMLLIDSLLFFEGEVAKAETTPCSKRWYSNSAGNMPAWLGIELMAQTTALHMALTRKQEGLPIRIGALLGTRHYHSKVADFWAGEPLCMSVHRVMRDSSGLGVYDCHIEARGDRVASARLKVYEPDDFGLFMQENTP